MSHFRRVYDLNGEMHESVAFSGMLSDGARFRTRLAKIIYRSRLASNRFLRNGSTGQFRTVNFPSPPGRGCAETLRRGPDFNLECAQGGRVGALSRAPACGDATVQPAKSVSTTGLTRVSAVRSPEGPLFRAATRTARTRNTAWRRFSSGFQPRISGTGH